MLPLSNSDIDVLKSYKFESDETERTGTNRKKNATLLCIKKGSNGLITVKREDVTRWEYFKKFFGCGKLTNVSLSLKEISAYLSEKDLSKIEGEAYDTLHGIAARCLFYSKSLKLWKKISQKTTKTLEEVTKSYSSKAGALPSYTFRKNGAKVDFYYTKKSTVKHVIQQIPLRKPFEIRACYPDRIIHHDNEYINYSEELNNFTLISELIGQIRFQHITDYYFPHILRSSDGGIIYLKPLISRY